MYVYRKSDHPRKSDCLAMSVDDDVEVSLFAGAKKGGKKEK